MTRLEWLQNLCLLEVNLVHKYVAYPKDYPMKNTSVRAHNGFLYTLEGCETYHFKDRDVCAVPNSVVFIPKGELYSIDFSGEKGVVYCFNFELEKPYDMRPFCIKLEGDIALGGYFSDAERKWYARTSRVSHRVQVKLL